MIIALSASPSRQPMLTACHHVGRANTIGLLALWFVNLSYASYLVMLQHVLSTRPFPFSLYSYASICGDAGIILAALPQFRQVRRSNPRDLQRVAGS